MASTTGSPLTFLRWTTVVLLYSMAALSASKIPSRFAQGGLARFRALNYGTIICCTHSVRSRFIETIYCKIEHKCIETFSYITLNSLRNEHF